MAGGDVFWVTFAGAFVVEVFVWFGAGDFAPEDEHAATSRPPATTIDSDRSNPFISVLPLVLDEILFAEGVPNRSEYRYRAHFVHLNQEIPFSYLTRRSNRRRTVA